MFQKNITSVWAIKRNNLDWGIKVNRKLIMQDAVALAKKAASQGEVPVGAIVLKGTQVIASSFNKTRQLNDPTAHAEILALRAAAKILGNYRLPDGLLYTTLEPCPMCAGAILEARINTLIFGAYDIKNGAAGSVYNLVSKNTRIEIIGGVEEAECSLLLKNFFNQKRNK